MFETLQKATLDKIFVLMAEYAADPRTNKIDLGVGVYKDEKNNTPIMSAVRKAEQRIHDAARRPRPTRASSATRSFRRRSSISLSAGSSTIPASAASTAPAAPVR